MPKNKKAKKGKEVATRPLTSSIITITLSNLSITVPTLSSSSISIRYIIINKG